MSSSCVTVDISFPIGPWNFVQSLLMFVQLYQNLLRDFFVFELFSLDEFPLLGIIRSKILNFTPKALPVALSCQLAVSVSNVMRDLSLSGSQPTFFYQAQCLADGLSGHPWRVLPNPILFRKVIAITPHRFILKFIGVWLINSVLFISAAQ